MLGISTHKLGTPFYKRETDLFGVEGVFIYAANGEQTERADSEEEAQRKVERAQEQIDTADKQLKRTALIKRKRDLEAAIRQINHELAGLDGIPY